MKLLLGLVSSLIATACFAQSSSSSLFREMDAQRQRMETDRLQQDVRRLRGEVNDAEIRAMQQPVVIIEVPAPAPAPRKPSFEEELAAENAALQKHGDELDRIDAQNAATAAEQARQAAVDQQRIAENNNAQAIQQENARLRQQLADAREAQAERNQEQADDHKEWQRQWG